MSAEVSLTTETFQPMNPLRDDTINALILATQRPAPPAASSTTHIMKAPPLLPPASPPAGPPATHILKAPPLPAPPPDPTIPPCKRPPGFPPKIPPFHPPKNPAYHPPKNPPTPLIPRLTPPPLSRYPPKGFPWTLARNPEPPLPRQLPLTSLYAPIQTDPFEPFDPDNAELLEC